MPADESRSPSKDACAFAEERAVDDEENRSLVGQRVLGRYRILHLLARGGMGEVYLARNEGVAGFQRPFVIKRMLAGGQTNNRLLALFQREARVMANLRHPGILDVVDFGMEGSDHLMALEYVHGFHLGRWQRWHAKCGRPFPVEWAIYITIQILEALQYVHTARGANGIPLNIVHRDVSPANVLIDVSGHVKLADFGVARMQGELTEVSGHGYVVGKLAYLAPELFDGIPATANSDVYAVGVVLDQLLRGRNPFKSDQVTETVARVVEHVPPPLHEERDDVSEQLAALIARSISKKAEERFADALSFADALRAVCVQSITATERELAKAAARDFNDPQMAKAVGAESLDTLERLCLSPTTNFDVPAQEGTLTNLAPQDHGSSPSHVSQVANTQRRAGLLLALGVLLGIGSAVVGFALFSGPTRIEEAELNAVQSSSTASALGPVAERSLESETGLAHPVLAEADSHELASTDSAPIEPVPSLARHSPQAHSKRRSSPRPVEAAAEPPPVESPPAEGSLNLLTIPSSEVFLEGRRLGSTPLVGLALPAGRHALVVRPVDGSEQIVRVTIAPGERTRLTVRLNGGASTE